MSAIPASSVSLKTMADGTLRISFDVEPGQAQDAFKLFAAPGTQVAIAALKDGSFLEQPVTAISATKPKPREHLGDACYRVVLWCNEPSFWEFLNRTQFSSDTPWFDFVNSSRRAAQAVKAICNVASSKELDTDNEANKVWHRDIRQPYVDYLNLLKAAA